MANSTTPTGPTGPDLAGTGRGAGARPTLACDRPAARNARRLGALCLLAAALLGGAARLEAQSCVIGRTPAFAVPSSLGIDPTTGQQVLRPLVIMQDATNFTGNQPMTANYPLTTSIDAEEGWIFNSILSGFQIWDARGAKATNPLKVVTVDGRAGQIPIYRNYAREDDFDVWAISAVPNPSPAAGDYLLALGGRNSVGLSIWAWDGTVRQVLYQDGDLNQSSDDTGYKQVYAAVIGGRAYAFGGGGEGVQQGIHVYDMTAAAGLASVPCLEDRNSGIAACTGVYKGVPVTKSTRYISGAEIGGSHYLIRSGAVLSRGLEIYNVATPGTPVLRGSALATTPVYGVAIWEHDGQSYAAARLIDRVSIWEITSCIGAPNGCGDLGTADATYMMPTVTPAGGWLSADLSWSNGRPMLYLGHNDTCHEGESPGHRSRLLDMSDGLAPVNVTPVTSMIDQGYEVDYWSWYYAYFNRGYSHAAPMAGVFSGPYFYRSHYSILDAHEFTPAAPGPPTADFTWTPSEIYPGTQVTFSDQSSGLPTSWQWTFPGGTPASSNLQNPTASFATVGAKNVTLVASNAFGSSTPKTKTVTVVSAVPAIGTINLSPAAPIQCQAVTFSPSSVTGQPPLTYAWSLAPTGGGTIATGSGTTLPWNTATGCAGDTCPAGSYTIGLQVSNSAGNDTESRQFNLGALTPLPANGSFAPTNDPFTNATVQFHVAVAGATEWNWNFGDGDTTGWVSDPVTGPNPTHTYDAIGNYNVTVSVRNCAEGPVTSAVLPVPITQVAPLVAGFSSSGLFCIAGVCQASVGQAIQFVDQSSGAELWDYDWNGDGSFEQANQTSPVTSHTYTVAGTYRPIQRVRRGQESATFTLVETLAVSVSSPAIAVSGPTNGQTGQPLTFTASASNCTPAANGWSWGTSGGAGSSTTSSISITWSTTGTKTVTASNSACGTALGSRSVSITSGGTSTLAANFTFSPSTPAPGQVVTFDASSSTGNPVGYYWTFGDGSPPVSAETPTAQHAFANGGTYSVRLEVSKPDITCPLGICTASTTKSVLVSGTAPSLAVSGPRTGSVGQQLSFSATATNCTPAANGWSWTTDGGSGTSTSSTLAVSWPTAGVKNLQVSNSACGTATGTATVTISAIDLAATRVISATPAATLLVPYFEVDFAGGSSSQTTLMAVSNDSGSPVLTSVTLWTDWGVPTLTFNVYLSGYDTQTLNLRDVLSGILPVTGPVSSNRGDPLSPEVAFPGCGDLTTDVPLPSVNVAELKALHQGLASPESGLCAGSVRSQAGLAAGYVTVDVVNGCSSWNPSSPGYFASGGAGVAGNANVLLGDYFLVNPFQNSAQGDVAVHVRANAEAFGGEGYTFYGRFVGGSGADNRQPLGNMYGSRYLAGGEFDGGTALVVWRDPKAPSEPTACGTSPAWGPLAQDWTAVFNEQGMVTLVQENAGRYPWATQRVPVGGPEGLPIVDPFGRFLLDLSHESDLFGAEAQGWVGVIASAEQRYSLGMPAQVFSFPLAGAGSASGTSPEETEAHPDAACEVEAAPAATLLVPYFEVDFAGGSSSQTTLMAVSNDSGSPVLTSVTLWTDWGVPTLTFNVYLSGYDTQTLNLRDVLSGLLPVTGPVSSNRGDPLSPEVAFPGCGDLTTDVPLPSVNVAELKALHQGLASPESGLCAGSVRSQAGLAAGYVTVDVVNGCSSWNPSSPGYFASGGAGVAGNANVLLGDYFLVNPFQNSAQGDVAVHVRANAEAFGGEGYTFYGRFVGGSGADNRQPLGNMYGSRYLAGGEFDGGTALVVWRDPKAPSEPTACGTSPAWGPLAQDWTAVVDEAGMVTLVEQDAGRYPWAAQRVPVGGPGGIPLARPFGRVMLDLSHESDLFGAEAQGWVGAIASAEQRYSLLMPAQVLRTICGPAE